MAFEDIADRLVADAIAQVGHGTHHAVIAPRAILASHAYHQCFEFLVHARASNRFARRRAITRLGHERAVPGEDGIGLRNRGDLI
jgi:hypothetical protein